MHTSENRDGGGDGNCDIGVLGRAQLPCRPTANTTDDGSPDLSEVRASTVEMPIYSATPWRQVSSYRHLTDGDIREAESSLGS